MAPPASACRSRPPRSRSLPIVPILGIGVNNYVAALPRYEATFAGDWLYTVHNKYLLVWAEAGIGGLVAFLWFLAATVRRGRSLWKERDPLLSPLALGLTAAFVGQMMHMAVDIFSSRSQVGLPLGRRRADCGDEPNEQRAREDRREMTDQAVTLRPLRRVTTNAAALFVGRALVMALSFVFLVGAARLLGVTEFGRYMLVPDVLRPPADTQRHRTGHPDHSEIARTPALGPVYLGTAAPLVIGLAALMGGLLVLVSPLAGYGPDVRSMLWLVCVALVPASFAMLCEAVFVAIGKAPYVMVGTFGEAALYASTGLIMLWQGHGGHSLFVALVATRHRLRLSTLSRSGGCSARFPARARMPFAKRLCRDWRTFGSRLAGQHHVQYEHDRAVGVSSRGRRRTLRSGLQNHELRLAARRQLHERDVSLYVQTARGVEPLLPAGRRRVGQVHAGHRPARRRHRRDVCGFDHHDALWERVWRCRPGSPCRDLGVRVQLRNPFVSHLLFARGEQVDLSPYRRGHGPGVAGAVTGTDPTWGAIGAAWTVLGRSGLACCLFCVAAFKPNPARVLMTFGKAGVAAVILAVFLAIWRHAHPAALAVGAVGVYCGVLVLLRVSSARDFSAFVRGLQ